jgi:hypothetical protein
MDARFGSLRIKANPSDYLEIEKKSLLRRFRHVFARSFDDDAVWNASTSFRTLTYTPPKHPRCRFQRGRAQSLAHQGMWTHHPLKKFLTKNFTRLK